MVVLESRATSGYQSRSLLAGMSNHQPMTLASASSTTRHARQNGLTRASTDRLLSAKPMAKSPTKRRDAGPSNHRAKLAQTIAATRTRPSSPLASPSPMRCASVLTRLLRPVSLR
jgi:hypothetical protein